MPDDPITGRPSRTCNDRTDNGSIIGEMAIAMQLFEIGKNLADYSPA